ncbi:MAG: AI-2E family transporter [Syntrophorhabdus sp.]
MMTTENRFYSFFIIFIVILLAYLSYKIINPFLSPIMWAVVLSLIFYPFYAFILKYVKYKSIASIITLLVITLILIGPVSYFVYVLSQELINLVNHFQPQNGNILEALIKHPLVNSLIRKALSLLNMSEQDLYQAITTSFTNFAKQSTGLLKSGFGNILAISVDFILMMFSIFFFLEDGPLFIEKLESFIPFSRHQRGKLLRQTKDIVVSTIYGGIIVGMNQGIIGGITFAILGIHSPVFWGLAMFVASFVPVVGTFIIWGPAMLYLVYEGHYYKAIILGLVGVILIGTIDNLLRPLIVKGKMKMPTIVIFFAILGGIQVFGLIGIILGPLVIALFISVFEIFRYSEEVRCRATEEPPTEERIDAGE